jgi:hypothetical protein
MCTGTVLTIQPRTGRVSPDYVLIFGLLVLTSNYSRPRLQMLNVAFKLLVHTQ